MYSDEKLDKIAKAKGLLEEVFDQGGYEPKLDEALQLLGLVELEIEEETEK